MARIYRPRTDHTVVVGQEILKPHAHEIAVEQLLPRIARQNQIAVETIQTNVHFYSKVRVGRRCSCFNLEISAASLCRACWGTGIVGGFDKYGTNTFVMDATYPGLVTSNVQPDYDRHDRPRHMILIPGATYGTIVAKVPLETNIGTIDHIFAATEEPNGSQIGALIKAPGDADWVSFTQSNFAQRLANPYVYIKVTMRRSSVESASPRFAMFFVRYNRLEVEDQVLIGNIPRSEQSNMLQEFGVTDEWQPQQFWLPNTLRSVTTEDWFAQTNDLTRWKVLLVNDFAPERLLLSWDIQTRLVYNYEAMNFFPL